MAPGAPDFDVAVVGAGPAGLTAGIYAVRSGLSTVVFESMAAGGQAATTDRIDNYPGFPDGIGGFDLGEAMRLQAERQGCAFRNVEVRAVESVPGSPVWTLRTAEGAVAALAVIAAGGAKPSRLGIPGEDRFWGRGVSCCATCDGAFFRGKRVVVVGGGDTAVQEAAFLTRFASHITLVHRRSRLRATAASQRRLAAEGRGKVEYLLETRPIEILGGDKVTGLRVERSGSGERIEVPCDGVFVFVGFTPASAWLPTAVSRDERGYVLTDEHMATGAPGIFACGDVRRKALRQVVTACAEGAVAAHSAQEHIDKLRGTSYE
ncbi:MAG TPA: FAD-dependent oxidoreductase [Planctomycetota bacterium]|nr:FAD-dependent oxidoreductase [Planctomycetota bacterium]